jgi:hemerythrin-like domain-containing protein
MGGKPRNKHGKLKPPRERLDHSHRRLEGELLSLEGAAQAIVESPNDLSAWQSIQEVLAYLQRAAIRHEADEEESVFPRLATHPALRSLLTRLRGEHRSQSKLVAALAGAAENKDPKEVLRVTKRLAASYRDHIDIEDRELLPAMSRHIDAESLNEIANEMAARRQSSKV